MTTSNYNRQQTGWVKTFHYNFVVVSFYHFRPGQTMLNSV